MLENTRLDLVATDGQVVVAAPLVARAKASQPVLARHLVDGVALVGRHKTPPDAPVRQLAALIEVCESTCPTRRLHIERDLGEAR